MQAGVRTIIGSLVHSLTFNIIGSFLSVDEIQCGVGPVLITALMCLCVCVCAQLIFSIRISRSLFSHRPPSPPPRKKIANTQNTHTYLFIIFEMQSYTGYYNTQSITFTSTRPDLC